MHFRCKAPKCQRFGICYFLKIYNSGDLLDVDSPIPLPTSSSPFTTTTDAPTRVSP